jgi:hypothetical protein
MFIAPVFASQNRLEAAIRWIFVLGFVLSMLAFVIVSINSGLDRGDNFEIAVISITWLVLIVNGILLAILFRRRMMEKQKV